MPYVTELVVGICVVRSQSNSCLPVKQRSEDSVSWHACRGRTPAGVLCEGLLCECGMHCDSRGLLLSD